MAAAPGGKNRNVFGFVVLIAFFAVAIYILVTVGNANQPQTVGMEGAPNPSVDNDRASGSKGFYEWTQALGYNPTKYSGDFQNLPQNASVLVSIAPNVDPTSMIDTSAFGIPPSSPGSSPGDDDVVQRNSLTLADGIAVRHWVEQGHTLLIFASSLPGSTVSAFNALKAAKSGPTTFASALGIYPQSAILPDDKRNWYRPLEPTQWTDGVDSVYIHPGYRLFDPVNHGLVLFAEVDNPEVGFGPVHTFPIAEVYSIGKGKVVAVSDDFFVCNRNLLRGQNATFIYRILTLCAHKGDTILFDEYHHVTGIEDPSVWASLGKPTQYAFWQFLLACLVALCVLAPRLGRPVPLATTSGRTSAEYVSSLAGLYQSAGVTTTALETIYRQFIRELCQRFGLPAGTSLDKLAETASRRGGVPADALKRLMVACEKVLAPPVQPVMAPIVDSASVVSGKKSSTKKPARQKVNQYTRPSISSRDLIMLVRTIERFRKELGIG